MSGSLRRLLLVLAVLGAVGTARAASVFDGDPIDPGTGRAHPILPGVPLILPQADGKFRPPIVDPGTIGDVDIVVRAGHLGIGPLMPPPVTTPPTAIAGGSRVVAGSEIPFTVIAVTAAGNPLGGTSLDGIPVVVTAFADLDGDGIVGPTTRDAAGAADLEREYQEAAFLIGRQVALFSGGVAQGTVSVWKGAPASAGGLTVVLTAMAYVGAFSPSFFAGNVPDGPGVATLMPFFPRLDPDRVVDGNGGGGRAEPGERLGVELEPAFDPPLDDPVLGTPFALPTDGTSATIDRARVVGGAMSRARFVALAPATGYDPEIEAPLVRGGGGLLFVPQTQASVGDDGPGNGTSVRLVPVDAMDQITDPPAGAAVTLVAGAGLAIAVPDADGDPTRETVPLASAAGIDVVLDDTGGTNDSGATSTVAVLMGGFPAETLAVRFTPGTGNPPAAPRILGAALSGQPTVLVQACPVPRTIVAVVEDASGAAPDVTVDVAANGAPVGTVVLLPGSAPTGLSLPPGPVYTGLIAVESPPLGLLELTVRARDAAGTAAPVGLALPVVAAAPPAVSAPALAPGTVAAGPGRAAVFVTAGVTDDCGVRRVVVEMVGNEGVRRVGRLRDNGRHGDAVERDGIFTGAARVPAQTPGTVALRVTARNRARLSTSGPGATLTVLP